MTTTKEPETIEALATIDRGTPLPAFSGQEMATAFKAYRELQLALDQAMPDQIIRHDNKAFRKKGYWRAIRAAFNLTVECIKEERSETADDWGWLVTYRAAAVTGRFADGDGACYASEKNKGRMTATEHNVRSHAHTRAFNRAVSNLCGFGEVSAEEIERTDEQAPAVHPPTPGPVQQTIPVPPREPRAEAVISEAQGKRLYAIAKSANWDMGVFVKWLHSTHGFTNIGEVTKRAYEEICAQAQEGPK